MVTVHFVYFLHLVGSYGRFENYITAMLTENYTTEINRTQAVIDYSHRQDFNFRTKLSAYPVGTSSGEI